MLVDSDGIPTHQIWGNSNFDSSAVDAVGRSGGICCLWDKDRFNRSSISFTSNYIMVSGAWRGVDEVVNVVNVYGPQDRGDKKMLWDHLVKLKNGSSGIWIFMGDFNAIRASHERSSYPPYDQSMADFNTFISDAGLNELNMGGSSFTWLKDDASVASRIDRFFVCDKFIEFWPLAKSTALERRWSDHRPITLISNNINYGPAPFRLFNSWITHHGLLPIVKRAWLGKPIKGKADYILGQKLKALKEALKTWCRDQIRAMDDEETKLESVLSTLDSKVE
ncbi:uncharacterized protein LOC110888922 [Helianthus annuus]|uniref:uncharacterized protein LOC110888922 n=1 Tax=Helianthus annuus TaxID=4232 RepID=UPI000B8F10CC|nr:uncharacterized protein LOC110888922 [Helianthus annuus]